MRTVTVQGKELKVAYNLKGLFVYEEITGHPYSGGKLVDTYMLLYSMLLANNEEFSLSFDEFINECDTDMNIYRVFVEVMNDEAKRVEAYNNDKKKAVSQ